MNGAAEAMGREGATFVDLAAEQECNGRSQVTWVREIGWIRLVAGRVQVGVGRKKMISASVVHSLVVSGNTGKAWSSGSVRSGSPRHGGSGSKLVPRHIEALESCEGDSGGDGTQSFDGPIERWGGLRVGVWWEWKSVSRQQKISACAKEGGRFR